VSEPAAYFGDRAGWYDDAYDRQDADGHALRARMAAVLRLVGTGPGDALDAGMGPGRLCAELERLGWTVSGVDASAEMVAAARLRLPDAAERLVCARVEQLPYEDATFDAVVATGVLEYTDVPRSLAELSRVLRPGGRALVSYPNPYTHYVLWKTRGYYPLIRLGKRLFRRPRPSLPRGAGAISRPGFRRLLASVGLETVALEPTSMLVVPSPLDSALPRLAAAAGRSLEGRGPVWLATQIVYAARKAGR
jgi:SAM-dependent methyltransferase